ncbi:MAG: hypothetical protein RLZZ518_1305, partial [Actinomycetota bacterium]
MTSSPESGVGEIPAAKLVGKDNAST